jgi:hypothetical protein
LHPLASADEAGKERFGTCMVDKYAIGLFAYPPFGAPGLLSRLPLPSFFSETSPELQSLVGGLREFTALVAEDEDVVVAPDEE